jgi:hypothetical protein
MKRDPDPAIHTDERAPAREGEASERPMPGGDVTVEEMSQASFPASDPPARWTWEIGSRSSAAEEV